jgi:hypothetical protein
MLVFGVLAGGTVWPNAAHAQGVTTSSVAGRVTTQAGDPVSDAQVVVINEATGAERGALTRADGRFQIVGLRPGGPYRIRVQRIGYVADDIEGLSLALGETERVNITLRDEAVAIEGIEVTAERDLTDRAGSVTTVDEEAIENTPTLGRDLADIVRLTPQAFVGNDDDDGPSISIAGQNNRYNSLYIDGAINNDVFGLSAQGTNGGQTGSTPISLDAIEEFQVAISPYDVTQAGFTGGAINAITRSGTNQFEGSAYYQFRNEDFGGLTPTDDSDFDRVKLPEFRNDRAGFRLGGPVVRDKLFFFVNGEILRSSTPLPSNLRNYSGESPDRLDAIRNILIDELDYDPGTFGDQAGTLDDNKLLAKVDWNVNDNHRITARHSFSDSENLDEFGVGEGVINFTGRAEHFPSTTNSTAFEWNSTYGSKYANKLILGATFVRDDRDFVGQPFPTINITDGVGSIRLGAEPFSTANILNQDQFSLTNNFNIFLGEHTLTLGTHNEFYSIENLFIPFNFGWYFYRSVDDFFQGVCAASFRQNGTVNTDTCRSYANSEGDYEDPLLFTLRGYSLVGDATNFGDTSDNIGAFDAYQLGVYLQDDWRATDRLRVSAGLRLDVPSLVTEPRFAPDVFDAGGTLDQVQAFHDLNGARPGKTPSAQLYLSPRVGINYDVFGDDRTTFRGGTGMFMGRVPFVWPGGMYLNNGANTGIYARFTRNELRPDPANGLTQSGSQIPSGRLEIFEDDFRYPTVWRTSAGIDQQLPWNLVGSLEGQYTKTVDNILVTNVNLLPANEQLDGPDNRDIIAYSITDDGEIDFETNLIDPRYTAIHRVGSTSEGYTYDVTARLEGSIGDNFSGRVAYTMGDAYALNDGTSSQINSIWAFQENVNGLNHLDLSRSDFSLGHRALGQVTYRQEFLNNLGTAVTLTYIGESGRPFSYTIGNSEELSGEFASDVSLLYVPNNTGDLAFVEYEDRSGRVWTAAEQQAEMEQFINGNEYLNSRRGGYAGRNGDRTPFENVIDMRLAQQVFTNLGGRRHGAEITLDIFNVTNLLNSDWGRRYQGINQYPVIEFEGFRDAANDDFTPQYTFRRPQVDNEDDIWQISDFGTYSSRWLMQLGVRYTF